MNNSHLATRRPGQANEASGQLVATELKPILSDVEADRRSLLLGELQVALAERGVQALVARHHRLALGSATRYVGSSGRTDPEPHIYVPDGATVKAATDATVYRLDDGAEYPVNDPAAAADSVCEQHILVTA